MINDKIFEDLFQKYFINEFLNDIENTQTDNISELVAIFQFHKSSSYKFSLQPAEHEKLVMKLVEITGDFFYAKEYPQNSICQSIILQHKKEEEEKVKFVQDNFELKRNIDIIEFEKNNQSSFTKPIFNSPQEIEFYYAAKTVFNDKIIW